MEATEILKEKFGYDQFRPGQDQVIKQVMAGENSLALMPTGGGKSLCYQVPALLFSGLTLVISPLIALMKDQVDALNANDIPATFINSSLTGMEAAQRWDLVADGAVKLLYLAPERLDDPRSLQQLQALPIDLVAIDEAHCISQWGHDFRPSYLNLTDTLATLPSQPVTLALTATATPQVVSDICQRLAIQADKVVQTSFQRENLTFQVVRAQAQVPYLTEFLKANPHEAGIIYASTRKMVEQLTHVLQKQGIQAGAYHGGLPEEQRRQNQEDFLYDRLQVMVATNAFGMGIDKSNVRFVIHAQLPASLEAYYQEAGRAGRDGVPSQAILLFQPHDVQIQHFLIEQSNLAETEKNRAYRKLQTMVQYAHTEGCLQQFILNYFGEDSEPCQRCGNCTDQRTAQDVTVDAQKVLSCVVRLKQRFGKTVVAQVLTGAKNQRIRQDGLDQLSTYNLMAALSQKTVGQFIDFLQAEQYLQAIGGAYPTLKITAKGAAVLKGQAQVYRKAAVKVAPQLPEDDGLFEQLRTLRRNLAEEQGVPPFVVFSDRTLHEMSQQQPQNETEFLDIHGVGASKWAKYGPAFLKIIQEAVTA